MIHQACPLTRRDSFSQDIQSECDMFEFQISNNWCLGEPDTDTRDAPLTGQIQKTKPKKRQGKYKNVPYTFGRHFRNWIETEIGPVKDLAVTKFINKRKSNPRYHDSFKDFNELFVAPGIGRQLGQIFFGQKLWIHYLLKNERVEDLSLYFQVEKSYYEAALTGIKLTEQKVRNI